VTALNVLLVDDDAESLGLLSQTLPTEVEGATIRWEPCEGFEKALDLIVHQRFDIVATDVYRDREGKKTPVTGDPQGGGILDQIRERRFCPVLFFTSGIFPTEYVEAEGPFVKLADKSSNANIAAKLGELIRTGVPALAHGIHDELDGTAGSYLWDFLESKWAELEADGLTRPEVLDRLVRRRAAVQLGRLTQAEGGGLLELPMIEGAEFYLTPRISSELRLGQIMRREDEYRVILTPHCYLAVQPGRTMPRAEFVLTVATVSASKVLKGMTFSSNESKMLKQVRQVIQSPARLEGRLDGRYWFLPGFLSMSDLYVDFLQLQSLPAEELLEQWDSFAVLDVPFAEALQSSFVRFYSAVGLPGLDAARFVHMAEGSLMASGQADVAPVEQ